MGALCGIGSQLCVELRSVVQYAWRMLVVPTQPSWVLHSAIQGSRSLVQNVYMCSVWPGSCIKTSARLHERFVISSIATALWPSFRVADRSKAFKQRLVCKCPRKCLQASRLHISPPSLALEFTHEKARLQDVDRPASLLLRMLQQAMPASAEPPQPADTCPTVTLAYYALQLAYSIPRSDQGMLHYGVLLVTSL